MVDVEALIRRSMAVRMDRFVRCEMAACAILKHRSEWARQVIVAERAPGAYLSIMGRK